MNANDNLKKEAEFQDSKIEHNVRQNLSKYYHDDAAVKTREYKKKMIGNLCGKRVLDIGCGAGLETMSALREGAIVTAIDISPASIEHVKIKAEEEGLDKNLTALVMDAHNLEFEDGVFDVAIGAGVLHHFPDLPKALREIKRVLSDDGYAVFHEPMGINPVINLFRKITSDKRTEDETPFRMTEINLIKSIFPNAEFEFFEFATLISKMFLSMHLSSFAKTIQKPLIKLDDAILRKDSDRISLPKKLTWTVLIKMKK